MKLGKIRIVFKDPDALDDAVKDHARETLADLGLDRDEMDAIVERRAEKIHAAIGRWFEHGEYVSIDIDLDASPATATVIAKGVGR